MAQSEPQTETLSLRISESLRRRLEQIRELVSHSKGEAGHLLSRAEWTVMAYFVQQGAEGFDRNPISRGSLVAILKAFQEVYKRLGKDASDREPDYYLGNLPSECRPEGTEAANLATPEIVGGLLTSHSPP